MVRIIHMSDLHVGRVGKLDFRERFHAVVDALIFEKGDHPERYVAVITGDLCDRASTARYAEVHAELERLKQAGFPHVLVVPGNHDYGTGSRGDRKFVDPFKDAFYGDRKPYPRVDVIDGVAFLGLDSMAEELDWYDALWSQGELGEAQLDRLAAALRTKDVRKARRRVVYLHHHPFDPMPLHELKDSAALEKTLQRAIGKGISIDAMLYGHNHAGKVHNGQWGIPRCYDAGSATRKARPKVLAWLPWFEVRAATRVIKIGRKDPSADYTLDLL